MYVDENSKCELVKTDAAGNETRMTIHDFKDGGGVVQGIHNTDASISGFAVACFEYALSQGLDLWFATKDTISKHTITASKTSLRRYIKKSTRENSASGKYHTTICS